MKLFLITILICSLFIKYIESHLKNSKICGQSTCKKNSKFLYTTGTIYKYEYETNILSILEDNRNDSKIFLKVDVYFNLRTECEGIIRVSKPTSLTNNDINDEHTQEKIDMFSNEISKYILRFSFDDGKIIEICWDENESNWSLNFKKGILSLFQNTMKRFDIDHKSDDLDINGICETNYKFLGANDSNILIERTKNFSNCKQRYEIESSIKSEPYYFPTLRDPNIIPAYCNCKYVVNRNIYKKIDCFEMHKFTLLFNQSIGIKIKISQKLTLKDENIDMNNEIEFEFPPITKRSLLLYNHQPIIEEAIENLKTTRDFLKEMCFYKIHDQSKFSDTFSQFIHSARLLSYTSLNQLFLRSNIICPNGREIFFETLPFIGNNPAVLLMKNLILYNNVTDSKTYEWLLTLALITKPNIDILANLEDILKHKLNDSSIRLSISTITHNYCRLKYNCKDEIQVQQIIKFFEKNIINLKHKDLNIFENQKEMLINLKSLANIGIIRSDFSFEINEIIENDSNPICIRISAIQAYRRANCETTRSYFIDIYRNITMNNELRIASYLQIINCPTYAIIKIIKHSLEVEKVNQVGSFVWTHLHNLLRSASPNKIFVQTLLSDDDLQRKFNNDFRKYSRNFKKSVYFDEFNAGLSISSNVIFSTSSYFPKTMMVNFTTYLFGKTINIFQFDSRFSGFENYIESIFGPNNPYNKYNIYNKLMKYRFKREPNQSKHNDILKRIENLSNKPHFDNNLKMSFSLSIFGSELFFKSFDYGNDTTNFDFFDIKSILTKLFYKEAIEFRKTILFMDFSYNSPTSVGFPIRLEGLGTSSFDLKFIRNLKANFSKENQTFDLMFDSSLNFSVNFNGKVFMDTIFTKSGVKLKADAYTSSSFFSNIKFRNGSLFMLNFSFPVKSIEILNAKSEFYILKNKNEYKWHDNSKNAIEKNLCSWPFFDKIMGLKFCSNLRFPNVTKMKNSSFLISPIVLRFFMEKTNDSIQSYVLKYEKNSNSTNIVFYTLGTQIEHIFETNLTYYPHLNLTKFFAFLKSRSFGIFITKGHFKNLDDEKSINIFFDINDKQYFNSQALWIKKETKHGHTYYPKFHLKINDENIAEFNGSIKLAKKKGIYQYDVNLAFQTKKVKMKLASYITSNEATLSTSFKLNYLIQNSTPQFIYMEFKMTNRSTKSLTAINGNFKLETSAYSHLDFDVNLTFQKTSGHIECKVETNYAPNISKQKLEFQILYIHYRNPDSNKLNILISLSKFETNLDLKFQLKHEMIGTDINSLILIRYAKNKDILITMHLSAPKGILFYLEGKLNVTLPTFNSMVIEGIINEKTNYDYDIELKAIWFSGHYVNLKGIYEDKSSDFEANHRLKFLTKSNSFNDVTTYIYYFKDNTNIKLETKAKYNNETYIVNLKHLSRNPLETVISAELKYGPKTYSISSFLNFTEKKTVLIELHLDETRDMQMYLKSYSSNKQKEYSIEIKWDANRDPNQKFIALFELLHLIETNYSAVFFLSYPGRTINSVIDLDILDYFQINLNSRLSWSSNEAIDFKFKFFNNLYTSVDHYLIELDSVLLTPFENLTRTSYSGRFFSQNNLHSFNSDLKWRNKEQIFIKLLSNYNKSNENTITQLNCNINSTFPKVSSLIITFDQYFNNSGLFSNFFFKYGSNKSIMIRSIWEIQETSKISTLIGTIFLTTDFNKIRHGLLTTEIHFVEDGLIDCTGNLNYDDSKYLIIFEGNFEKILDNFFILNISTPIEKYEDMHCRFGISEKKRHIIAEVSNLNETIGFEIKMYFAKFSDFDIKFRLSAPTEYFQKTLLVAKIKDDNIDFQIGWNAILAGITGVWYFDSTLNFQYMYKIYIPFEKVEQVGFTLKLITDKEFDFEAYIYLVYNKFGLKILAKPRNLSNTKIKSEKHMKLITFNEGLIFLKNDSIDYIIEIISDLVILPTIHGTFDFHKQGSLNSLSGYFILPNGRILITNEFYFENLLKMSNKLLFKTPFHEFEELKLNYNIDVVLNSKYVLTTNSMLKTNESEIIGDFLVNYELKKNEDNDFEAHELILKLNTPLQNVPIVYFEGLLEFEENLLNLNCSIRMKHFFTSININTEIDDGFIENALKLHVNSSILQIQYLKLYLRKEFYDFENRTDFSIDYYPINNNDRYYLETKYHLRNFNNYFFVIKLSTPSIYLKNFHSLFNLTHNSTNNILNTRFELNSNLFINISSIMNSSNLEFNFVKLTHNDYYALQIKGMFYKQSDKIIKFNGKLLIAKNKDYNLNAIIILDDNQFIKTIDIQTEPSDLRLQLNATLIDNIIKTKTQLNYFKKIIIIDSDIRSFSRYQWNIQTNVKMLKPSFLSKIQCNFHLKKMNNLLFDFNVTNSLEQMTNSYLRTYLKSNDISGDVKILLTNSNIHLNTEMNWIWKFLENMKVTSKNSLVSNKTIHKSDMIFFYENPENNFINLNFGSNILIGNNWQLLSNNSFFCPDSRNISTNILLKLPAPMSESYLIEGGLLFGNATKYFIKFDTESSKENFSAFGDTEINDHLISSNNTVKFGVNASQIIQEVFHLKKISKKFIELYIFLKSPYFDEGIIFSKLMFGDNENYSNLLTTVSYPNDTLIFIKNIDYKSFSNMKGLINISVPFEFKHFIGSEFNIKNERFTKNYFVKLFWTNDSAILSSNYKLNSTPNENNVHGLIIFEFPLTTRHFSNISYQYKEIDNKILGNTTIFYNKTKILEGKYDSILKILTDAYYSNHVKMELLNEYYPLCIIYGHKYPINNTHISIDTKTIQLSHLYNKTKFNISGEIRNKFKENGKETQLIAIAKNRTIILNNNYLILTDEFLQNLQIKFVETNSWFGYELKVRNETLFHDNEAHHFYLNIYYPLRNFSLISSYKISNFNITSSSILKWTKYGSVKSVESSFSLIENSMKPINKKIIFNICHPSFKKNISFEAEIYRNYSKLIDLLAILAYSNNEDKDLKIYTNIDNTQPMMYIYQLNVTHPATNLLMKIDGQILINLNYYFFKKVAQYKRTYLPQQSGELIFKMDLNQFETEFQKKTLRDLTYLLLKYKRIQLIHDSNLVFIYGPDINASGHFVLNLHNKQLNFHLNKTTDGSESLHLIGSIPDARNAELSLYRDYENIRISDILYFIKLNHSRLLTSKLNWRPELRQDVRNLIKEVFTNLYDNFLDNLDFWRHYIRSESVESLNDIWLDAKPIIRDLLNDIKGLKVIEDDFDQFKKFFNNSYNINEFYIKDIIDTFMYVLKELSKRSKLENLPAVITEIIEVLGDSGDVIRKSIAWFIETTKTSYNKIVELFEMILRGDLLLHISTILENFIHKYDIFVKELHVNVLTFIEEFINSFYDLFLERCNLMLKAIEPTFLRLVHYLETIVYNTSKQFLDFLYKRRSEIIESKYFNQFAKFAQDIDYFYQDFITNDMLTNLSKYSKVLWNFLREKFYKLIPFAKELSNIGTEIYNEILLLKNLPSIKYLIEKYNELHDHFMWIFNYFDTSNRLNKLLVFIQTKFSEVSLSAIESENMHRKAKSNFIFDLEQGYMELEQKIPIPWHAFNETPKFEEIPEYKFITHIKNYFSLTNTTFWTLYYQFKLYNKPTELMPPFKAYAMITSNDGFMTFDRKFYRFLGNCQYLLANDFKNNTFFLVINYHKNSTYTISINQKIIEINIFTKEILIENILLTKLPFKYNDTYIYQDVDIITIKNQKGFEFRCNIKFNICLLELSGWYFGKTVGLLGTINNEYFDDFYPILNDTEDSLNSFTKLWNLNEDTCISKNALENTSIFRNTTIIDFCKSLFGNRLSQFEPCFSIINPKFFKYSCLTSTTLNNMCSVIMSYIEVCSLENRPLKMPSLCVQCQLLNGSFVYEGDYIQLQGNEIPKSADIVFIVEAKSCNENIRIKRNIDSLINNINKELTNINFTSNRYAVVLFGGNNILDEPKSVIISNEIFTNYSKILQYFDNIPVGNGTSDIFYAMNYASKLIYRPGIKRIFILIPCSTCDIYKTNLDYNIVNQMLFEKDVTLHILMNDDFQTNKIRIKKNIFGIDKKYAYTKKDSKILTGDTEIRNEVQIMTFLSNYCSYLALESNGSLFSALKLELNKKFSPVFAKRLVQNILSKNCQTCQCTANNNGIPFMECYSCYYQHPSVIGFDDFDEDIQQSFKLFRD